MNTHTPKDPAEYGRVAYQAYAASTGGKTYDGRDMPTWEGLTPRIREAWSAAAGAVIGRHSTREGTEATPRDAALLRALVRRTEEFSRSSDLPPRELAFWKWWRGEPMSAQELADFAAHWGSLETDEQAADEIALVLLGRSTTRALDEAREGAR